MYNCIYWLVTAWCSG